MLSPSLGLGSTHSSVLADCSLPGIGPGVLYGFILAIFPEPGAEDGNHPLGMQVSSPEQVLRA